MMTSLFIAKILGTVMVLKAIGIFLKGKEMREMVDEITRQKFLLYVVTTIELVAGLVIVLTHNVWGEGWQTVITVLGWLFVLEGAYFMLFPFEPCMKFMKKMTSPKWMRFWGLLALIVGLYLAYFGFGLNS